MAKRKSNLNKKGSSFERIGETYKFLIIQQKMIGDVLTSTILFDALRKEYPEAELHYLIYKHTKPVVANNPNIDKLILFDPDKIGLKKLPGFIAKIRDQKFDVVIDVYSKIGTALITGFSGAPTRISYKKWYTRMFYTRVFKRNQNDRKQQGTAINDRMQLLTPVIKDILENVKPKIYLESEEIETANKKLEQAGLTKNLLFIIAVMGSNVSKTYPLLYLAKLLDAVVERTNGNLLLNYIPKQRDEVLQILGYCNPQTKNHIITDSYASGLRDFLSLTACCDALIGNEGGAVNMAKALNIPTFAIFSPQIGKEDWGLYQSERNVSVHLKDYCPQLFQEKSGKEIKRNSENFYQKFKPELMLPKLEQFLNSIS